LGKDRCHVFAFGFPVSTNGRQYCFTVQQHRANKHPIRPFFESDDRSLSLHKFNDSKTAVPLPGDIKNGAGTEKVLACQTAICVGNQSHGGRFPPDSAYVKPPTIVAQASSPVGCGGVPPPPTISPLKTQEAIPAPRAKPKTTPSPKCSITRFLTFPPTQPKKVKKTIAMFCRFDRFSVPLSR